MKMRKCAAAAVAVGAALVCMPGAAMADITLENLGTLENVEWVSGTNLIQTEGDNGYGLQTVDGTAVTEQIYGRSMYCEKGYITVYTAESGLNSEGLISQEGKELMPLQYGDIDVLSNQWALGFILEEATSSQYDYTNLWGDEAYYLIQTVDVYHIENGEAVCLASLGRDEYMDAYEAGKYINIQDRSTSKVTTYDAEFQQVATDVSLYEEPEDARGLTTFRDNGQYGLMDSEGNVVMEASFYTIYDFDGDYARVSTGDKEGLIDKQGNVVVPAEFDDVDYSYYAPLNEEGDPKAYNCYGYYAVEQDGKLGYIDASGAFTCEPKYSADVADNYGASATLTDLEGNTILQAADGTETVLEGYESIYALSYGSGMYYEVRDAEYNSGMIDWHGNVVLPLEYSDIELSGDGTYVLAESSENYGSCELYRLTFTNDSAAAVVDEEGAASDGEEAEAADTGNVSAVGTLLDSAATTLSSDSKGTRSSAVTLLENAKGLLGEGNDGASALIDSAISLLQTEGSDLNSVVTLINNAKGLL